ncbi:MULTISPECIES: hypothetical protein [unclassified Luteococcus]|uniref:hypothetical protein n=1 Tax=unclassified Luteococcus TaxID=2639923 RepID=UPI00313C492D
MMVWLLLWCGIGLLWLAMLLGCGWMLWRKARALVRELAEQGRTLGELVSLLGELELPAERDAAAKRSTRTDADAGTSCV